MEFLKGLMTAEGSKGMEWGGEGRRKGREKFSVLSASVKEIILHPKPPFVASYWKNKQGPQAGSCQFEGWKNRHWLFVFICLLIHVFI